MFMSSETRWESEDEDNHSIIDALAEVSKQTLFVQLIEDAPRFAYAAPRNKKNGRKKRRPHSSQALVSAKIDASAFRGEERPESGRPNETVDGIVALMNPEAMNRATVTLLRVPPD